MGKRQDRSILVCASLLLLVVACSDASLDGFGVTEDWLGERTAATVAPQTTDIAPGNVYVGTLDWYTPPAASVPSEPDAVVEELWSGSTQEDAFVQAAANQISAAVPGIKITTALPPETTHVTSQIVFGVSTGRLTNAYVAAFGFWKSEPYVTSRTVSQVAQLTVAIDDTDPAPAPDDATLGCVRFNSDDIVSCDPAAVDGSRAWWVIELDGAKLVWFDEGFRYELLDRQRLGVEAMTDIANSSEALSAVEFPVRSES